MYLLWCLMMISAVLVIGACGVGEPPAGLAGLASPSPGDVVTPSRMPTLVPASPAVRVSLTAVSPTPSSAASVASTATARPTSTQTGEVSASPSLTVAPTDTPMPSATTQPSDALTPTPTASRVPKPRPTATLTPKPVPAAGDPAAVRVELQVVVGGLDTPLAIANAGDGSGRLFVVEKKGLVRVVQDGALAGVPFLDIRDRVGSSSSEQGLLGLAFHPDYENNGLFFVNYTSLQGATTVARYAMGAETNRADAGSEVLILSLDQPAANHNGGHLAFGPDGYLYIGTGDGGGSGDRYGNGQNGQTLLGTMLRLDVDSGLPYVVPATNPFAGRPNARDEIWALGLRNPWRYSFDRLTGDLYIADVGQNQYEEVNFQPATSGGGQNYGWPIMEGKHCFPADQPCERAGLVLPVREYDHTAGCSVTGGYVYRGQDFPVLTGIYLFGDYCSGRIWGLSPAGDGEWRVSELARADGQLSSFGEDERGELYLLDMGRGELLKVVAHLR
ncbi:PQQ-dependent sugar dehydrogenase [Chloroflexota bacterium]